MDYRYVSFSSEIIPLRMSLYRFLNFCNPPSEGFAKFIEWNGLLRVCQVVTRLCSSRITHETKPPQRADFLAVLALIGRYGCRASARAVDGTNLLGLCVIAVALLGPRSGGGVLECVIIVS